jgi:hypothetical protein
MITASIMQIFHKQSIVTRNGSFKIFIWIFVKISCLLGLTCLITIMMKLMAKTTIIMIITISLWFCVSLHYIDPLYGYFHWVWQLLYYCHSTTIIIIIITVISVFIIISNPILFYSLVSSHPQKVCTILKIYLIFI